MFRLFTTGNSVTLVLTRGSDVTLILLFCVLTTRGIDLNFTKHFVF